MTSAAAQQQADDQHDHHDHDHHHGDEEWEGDDSRHPLWDVDHIQLTSVGIDVGSATSQVLFSRLELHRLGSQLSSRYVVVSREIVYRSQVHLTPYAEGLRIDEGALHEIVADAFSQASLTPKDIDTGAIILTGEATRRENARAIADVFAAQSGAFVCATAGHHMEATLAAYGSGAVKLSRDHGCRVLNIDIGGGTTKLAVVEDGEVVQTAALHIGGRLAAVDGERRLVRLEPAGKQIAAAAGHAWELGELVAPGAMEAVCERMAATVLGAVNGLISQDVVDLLLTEGLRGPSTYDAVLFSGGVSEYVYGHETTSYGDLGQLLGAALRRHVPELPGALEPAAGGIRATVLGASQYTVQVSGNTIYVSNPRLLPLQNLQVVYPKIELGESVDPAEVAEAIRRHVTKLDVDVLGEVAFAFQWQGAPSFVRLNALVRGIEDALTGRLAAGLPLCLLFEGDIARTVGAMLKEDHGHANDVVCIDGVTVTDFEFIDVGAMLEKSQTVPISIKSLIFHL
jgi:ethanolamine utilization protein EutA